MRTQIPVRTHRLTLFLWLALIAAALGFGCSESDDVAQIRKLIADAAHNAETHDIAEILDKTTDDVRAEPGGHGKRSVRGVLWWAFKHYGEFSIIFPEPKVNLADSGVRAEATVVFIIVKKGGIIPDLDGLYDNPQRWVEELGEAADLYRLELSLASVDGEWRANKAELSPYN